MFFILFVRVQAEGRVTVDNVSLVNGDPHVVMLWILYSDGF